MPNKYLLLIGELLIPILGYVFWDWSLYFLFLFLFIDLLMYQTLYFFKANKISLYTGQIQSIFKKIAIGIALLLISAILFCGFTFVFNAIEQTDYKAEIIAFWKYKDMGIEQGYVLVPLVVITAIMSYKTEFILQRNFEKTTNNQLIKQQLLDSFACIFLLVLNIALYYSDLKINLIYFIFNLILIGFYKFYSQKITVKIS